MSNAIIDVGLICVGSEVTAPITVCNSNPTQSIPEVYVTVTLPKGVQFVGSDLPRGVYDQVTKIWSVGTLSKAECISGSFRFLITDDRYGKYKFNYSISTTAGCADCKDASGCAELQGLSCSQILKCEEPVCTEDYILECGSGLECTGNATSEDCECPLELEKTFEWINTDTARGTITGTPDNFTYRPDADFCGQAYAEYGLYCNDLLQSRGRVLFTNTCANAADDEFSLGKDSSGDFNVSLNDFKCLYGS